MVSRPLSLFFKSYGSHSEPSNDQVYKFFDEKDAWIFLTNTHKTLLA